VTAAEVETEVLGLLAKYVRKGVAPHAGTDILADTGMESVDVMDFVMELEETFDITVPLDRLTDLRTAGDVAGAVQAIVAEQGGLAGPAQQMGE